MATNQSGTLILTGRDVRELLDMRECIDAVERAFALHGSGEAAAPAVASVHVPDGGFHIKAGVMPVDGRSYFVAKTNGNFPMNPDRHGLPTIQGTLVVCDANVGTPLAVMDSAEITALRTAAATAVAVRHLARKNASRLAIIGCGQQGAMHVQSLSAVMHLSELVLFDTNAAASNALARTAGESLRLPVRVTASPADAAAGADVCVTCTTSRSFLLDDSDVSPGMLIAGVGVDWEEKRELDPALLRRGRVVTDVIAQCAKFGDLHHAIDAGVMTVADVHAELGEIVAGRKPGRESEDDVIVFDSTGMALQDVAAAALVYQRALVAGRGMRVTFND